MSGAGFIKDKQYHPYLKEAYRMEMTGNKWFQIMMKN